MPELHCPMLAVILYEGQGEISTHGIRTESKSQLTCLLFLKISFILSYIMMRMAEQVLTAY